MTIDVAGPPRIVADGLVFPECPRWHDGALWFSDMYGRTVYRLAEGGAPAPVCTVAGRPGGLGFLADGTLLVTEMETARVLRLTPDGLIVHADMAAVAANGVNDMVVRADGGAYVGRFFHDYPPADEPLLLLDPDGTWRDGAEPLRVANGMVLTADERRLIVAESAGARLSAFALDADGTPGTRETFAELPPGHFPDGICGDAAGGIWVSCCTGPGLVRVEEGGRVTHRVVIGDDRFAFACALGGGDGATLFICTAGAYDRDGLHAQRAGRIEAIAAPYPGSGTP